MKSEVKKLDNAKREISVEVSADVVKDKFENAFKKISETALVPGFRPGHVPRDILEKDFSHQAHELVLRELIPDAYEEVVKKEGLDVIELPEISDVKLDRSSLTFKATVEIAPQIKVKDCKGIKLNYKKVEVTPDELKRNLDAIKESRKLDALDDRFAKSAGYPNLAELEKAVERQIFLQKENLQRRQMEEALITEITKGLDFKAPQSMVKRQLEDLVKQAKVDMALKGFPREKIDAQEKELIKELEPQAKRQVEVYLVLAEIAKQENIAIDDHMPHNVLEFLLKEADWQEAS